MNEYNTTRLDSESLDEYIWRLGSAKKSGDLIASWDEIAETINKEFDLIYGESAYRKRYKAMVRSLNTPIECTDFSNSVKEKLIEVEHAKQRIHDERVALRRRVREDARVDDFCNTLINVIKKAEPLEYENKEEIHGEMAVYALLSDIHYGMCFDNAAGTYNSEIAEKRVMDYASYIIDLGVRYDVDTCYVSLLGDLVSGQIHSSIRVENREDIIQQIVGVSELVSLFLYRLASYYHTVYVNSVDGNHSRLEANIKNDIRSERLDRLIPWYCKAKLSDIDQIKFIDNELDSTIGIFEIFGKSYVSVHGDFDTHHKDAAHKIYDLYKKHVDYFISGHMHVPAMRFENISFIQNGAVISGGDDYTMRNRLFAPAQQVCMVVSANGVESVHPVKL